jgi:hypothetical protein
MSEPGPEDHLGFEEWLNLMDGGGQGNSAFAVTALPLPQFISLEVLGFCTGDPGDFQYFRHPSILRIIRVVCFRDFI